MKCRILIITTLLSFVTVVGMAQPNPNNLEWMQHIRTDHPRLFLTGEDIPQIKFTATSFEEPYFAMLKRRIGKIIDQKVVLNNPLAKTGEHNKNDRYGNHAAESAILWLITGEQRYLEYAKYLIKEMTAYYELRVANNLNIGWFAFPQICTLCAYDWIYNDLLPIEREEMGRRLYHALFNVAWHGPGLREKRYRENPSRPNCTGFYGSSVLPWFIGLTFYGEGINDKECERMVRDGYADHCKMSSYRAALLGKSGGCSSGTPGYGLGAYPYAEYDFIYTLRSAIGIDITPQMEYMLGYLNYMDWCRLPGNKEFGAGDSFHNNNLLPKDIPTHIKEIANLFGRNHPKVLDWASELVALYNKGYNPMRMTFMPLLHNFNFTLDEYTEPAKHKSCVIHFESLGQIIMRTGRGDNDTYAMFMTGRSNDQHQHFDINNFTIYKHGYRALDSGTRPQPGLHLSHYYARTVAHNCITIRMPGEEMPHYWGGAAKEEDENTPFPNDGGQRVRNKGKLLALNESDDYVYIASDATEAYHEDKAEQVVREFVWLKPDIFVIYDRVVSDKAEYPKRWLYHIASEPIMNGKMEFSEVSQGGKSICRTLLPKKAKLELVGGEGKQFWSEGRNWPIPDMHKSWLKNTNPLMGQWRVEVSPKKAATRDHFLHIVQVGDKNLAALPKTKCEESKESATLSFDYEGQHYSLTFDKRANYGCKIKIDKL